MFHSCRHCAACHPFPDSDIENASVVSQGILGYGIAYVETWGAGGGGRRLAYERGGDACRIFWITPLKAVFQAFFLTAKRDHVIWI